MSRLSSHSFVVPLVLLMISASACTAIPYASPSPTPTVPTATLEPTSTFTPTMVPPTATPTITPTATWVWQPAGQVTCPILLYHHVADITPPAWYYISPADFEAEMNLLRDGGYTPIPISLLIQAITQGANLPPRPVVITFDDGNEDIFTNAFPIMQRLGFQGVLYIVSSRLGSQNYLGIPEISQMVSTGWEVGDHSRTHLNLVDNPGLLWDEAVQSRMDLKAALNLPIDTFAYPFGAATESTMGKVSRYGYKAAVGLGISPIQGPFNLFYLNRIVLDYRIDLNKFNSLIHGLDQ
jgi:peptidoglycan/xylan/chitin deacetylase (PgdA/CDA1 family)